MQSRTAQNLLTSALAMNAQLHAFEFQTCPRAAAWMASLCAATGDRMGAGQWLLELIAWMAFDDAGRRVGLSQVSATEQRC
jgi:hypothetical protein